jgi:hypothetical protein
MTDFDIVEATNDNFEGYDDELQDEPIEIPMTRMSTLRKVFLCVLALTVILTSVHLATEVAAWGIMAILSGVALVCLSVGDVIWNWYA